MSKKVFEFVYISNLTKIYWQRFKLLRYQMSHKIEGICTYKCSNATSDKFSQHLVRCSNHFVQDIYYENDPLLLQLKQNVTKDYHQFIFVHKVDNCFAYNLK